jgi:ribose transport system substrate-binding protein
MLTRRLLAILAGISTCALAATAIAGTPETSAATLPKPPYTLALTTFFEGNSFQAEDVQLFGQFCKQYPEIKRCIAENANDSVSTQIAQIEALISEHVSAILLDASSTTALNGVVQKALNAGIPVINFNTLISGNATLKINYHLNEWGSITANWLVNQLHGKGNIIVLNGLAGNPAGIARWLPAEQIFKAHPGIHILAIGYASWDQATAESVVAPMLEAYPNINGVWSQGGAMTAGAIIDFLKAGRKLVPMTGEDYNLFLKQWTEYMPKGFTAIAPGDPNYQVQIAVAAAVRALQGKTIAKSINIPLPLITDATAKNYYKPNKPPTWWVFDQISQALVNKYLAP